MSNKLTINKITLNQDNSLFCVATNIGYRVYETNSFKLLSTVDDYTILLGSLDNAITLYSSSLIAFVGSIDNIFYPPTQLAIWDDLSKRKIGLIILKMNIFDFKISKNGIFILIPWKILIFDLKTFKYICTLEDVDISINKFTTTLLNSPMTVAYGSWSNKGIIKINKFLTDNHQIYKKKQLLIITTFYDIGNIKVDDSGVLLYVSTKFGNKAHIYSLNDYELRYCFYFGHEYYKMLNINFGNKNKYLLLMTMNFSIIILNLEKSTDTICQCDDYDDITEEESIERRPSLFGSFFSAIKSKIIGEEFTKFAYYQVKNVSKHIVSFFSGKNEISIINIPNIEKIEFDKKNGGLCKTTLLANWLY